MTILVISATIIRENSVWKNAVGKWQHSNHLRTYKINEDLTLNLSDFYQPYSILNITKVRKL